ncbi:MAG: SUMF1/EgtB/PvdO family nonheme iron enzyme [Limisphaerales bacterium]
MLSNEWGQANPDEEFVCPHSFDNLFNWARRGLWSVILALCATATLAAAPITNTAGIKLHLIPAGHFAQGMSYRVGFGLAFNCCAGWTVDEERPEHLVILSKPFYLAETEVTVGQFKQFVAATGHRTTAEQGGKGIMGFQPKPPTNAPWLKPAFEQRVEFTWKNPGFPQTDQHPVVGVSWRDAVAFCEWLTKQEGVTYRLPTEAEWEYACRAGTDSWFNWGNEFRDSIHRRANIANAEYEKAWPDRAIRQWMVRTNHDDGHVFTAPVGSYPANAWGLRDLHGNVWEWCADRYTDTYYKKFAAPRYDRSTVLAVDPVNQEAWNAHGDWRTIRGGSWAVSPVQCRSTARSYFEAADAGAYLGFRVAREAPPEALAVAQRRLEADADARQAVLAAIGDFNNADGALLKARFPRPLEPELFRRLPDLIGLADLEFPAARKLSPEFLALLPRIPDLRGFRVSDAGPQLTAADFAPLAQVGKLESLELSGDNNFDDAAVKHLAGLVNLRRLSLNSPRVTDAGVRELGRLKKLEQLTLQFTSATGASLDVLAGAPLQTLSVGQLDDAAAAHLRLFPQLRELASRDATLTAAGFAHLAGLRRLDALDLTNARQLTDDGFAPLAQLASLRRFHAVGSGLGDRGVRHLVGLNLLGELHLGSSALTDAGMRSIGELVGLTGLFVSKDSTQVTDRGLEFFWRLHQLRNLSLNAPNLTGSGFAPLTELAELRDLSLGGAGLTDAAFAHLADVPNLERVEIGDGQRGGPAGITADGLLRMAKAPKLKSLSVVRKGTRLTDEDVQRLRSAFGENRIQVR